MPGWTEVASGDPMDLYAIRSYDELIPEGSRGMLKLNLRLPVSQSTADAIEDALRTAGIPDVYVRTASPELKIFFKKGFPWLPVIVGVIIPLLIILAITVISWQLFKENPVAAGMTLLLGIGVAAAVGAYALGKSLKGGRI